MWFQDGLLLFQHVAAELAEGARLPGQFLHGF
jgi:hypothetical protein